MCTPNSNSCTSCSRRVSLRHSKSLSTAADARDSLSCGAKSVTRRSPRYLKARLVARRRSAGRSPFCSSLPRSERASPQIVCGWTPRHYSRWYRNTLSSERSQRERVPSRAPATTLKRASRMGEPIAANKSAALIALANQLSRPLPCRAKTRPFFWPSGCARHTNSRLHVGREFSVRGLTAPWRRAGLAPNILASAHIELTHR